MAQIELTQGQVAIVDDADFEYLNQWKWTLSKDKNTFYAIRKQWTGLRQKTILMHRVIMNASNEIEIDHRDQNGLNNTRDNLRVCTHTQNSQNKNIFSSNTSGYKGVTWHKHVEKWNARITVNGNRISLGYFSTAEDAGRAYDIAANKYFGEFARTNSNV